MIKTILFDVDGVLVNGKRFSETLEHDLNVPKEKSLPFFTGIFLECLVGKADLKKELEPLLKEWHIHKTVEEFIDYWFRSEHVINEKLIDEVNELKAKGINCHIVTNQEKYRMNYIIHEMGFGNIFDKIFSSAEIGYAKPQKEFFETVLTTLNAEADEVLFVDDTVGHIEAAKKLGMNTILYVEHQDFTNGIKKIFTN